MSGRMPPRFRQELGMDPETNGRAASGATVRHLTDLGNAERLTDQHGDDLRYVHPWAKWLCWDGGRWKPDSNGEIERRARETVRTIYTEAESADGKDERKAIARHAAGSEARSRIDAMIALARSMVPAAPEELDADPWLLNAANGTVDLRTGELRDHRRADLITKATPVDYDPDAQAPRFARFLREIFDGDEGMGAFVQRFAGYSLTGSTRERAVAILHGTGKNGKTTLIELLQEATGDYAATTETETILAKRYQGVGNDVAALKGARFVATAEVEKGRRLAESKVKQLTGNDTVTARFLYSEPFSFKPEFKLWLSTNSKPEIHGTDDAIWDRIRLIPFTQRFEGADADAKLPEKLRDELPGVLAWAVRGCLEWQRDGLGEPDKVRAATEGYRAEQDTLAGFVDEECVVRPDAWCKFADLYAAYTRWCEESNEHPEKKRRFADRLTERGYAADNGVKNVAIRRGIALRHGGPDDPGDPAGVNDPPPISGPEPPDPATRGGEYVNPVNDPHDFVNPQNTRKTEDSGAGVNEGYPKSNNLEPIPREEKSVENTLTLVNSLTRGAKSTPRDGLLSPEQAARVQRLTAQGMKATWARAEVLGDGAAVNQTRGVTATEGD